MDLLNNLITTLNLDKSFFYQLVLALVLYFISKKLFLSPYLESFHKREELTKGRMTSNKELEEKIENIKSLYEQKAKSVHEQFQELFDKTKHKAQDNYQKEILKIQEEQMSFIKQERTVLNQSLKDQEKSLKKDLPFLTKLLIEKIKSSA